MNTFRIIWLKVVQWTIYKKTPTIYLIHWLAHFVWQKCNHIGISRILPGMGGGRGCSISWLLFPPFGCSPKNGKKSLWLNFPIKGGGGGVQPPQPSPLILVWKKFKLFKKSILHNEMLNFLEISDSIKYNNHVTGITRIWEVGHLYTTTEHIYAWSYILWIDRESISQIAWLCWANVGIG